MNEGNELIYCRTLPCDSVQYYIPVNTTLSPSSGVSCLGQHVLAHMCHLQVWFLVTIILSCILSIDNYMNYIDNIIQRKETADQLARTCSVHHIT